MALTPAQASAAFLADPLGFLGDNLVIVRIHGYRPSNNHHIRDFAFRHADQDLVKKNKYHWYNSSVDAYYLETHPAGTIRAYTLGFQEDDAIGATLGVAGGDPRFMFTYRMDGCTLGYAQAGVGASAYVSHHNHKSGGNVAATLQAQVPVLEPGGAAAHPHGTVLQYMHKDAYMTRAHAGTLDVEGRYKSTTFGIREATGRWRFYTQTRKRHGELKDHQWTLKGLTCINP